jgi:hypothetical protein
VSEGVAHELHAAALPGGAERRTPRGRPRLADSVTSWSTGNKRASQAFQAATVGLVAKPGQCKTGTGTCAVRSRLPLRKMKASLSSAASRARN